MRLLDMIRGVVCRLEHGRNSLVAFNSLEILIPSVVPGLPVKIVLFDVILYYEYAYII